ncbi:hypothetical protein M9H77_22637 [Catharanthus roseus]|uniref:Uncharacterized protein n=1 Tax=Catharanthus roseus TaxID=4058 RepID=A0ACC0AT74_CATRO|nr:hypothetical protein M9H77_22637 [Catharanthus roseus]
MGSPIAGDKRFICENMSKWASVGASKNKETLNDSIVQNTKSCVKIENQSLGAALLYSLTFKKFLDELNFKRELKVLQVLMRDRWYDPECARTVELFQGSATRAMARRIEEKHRGKIEIFKKTIETWLGK